MLSIVYCKCFLQLSSALSGALATLRAIKSHTDFGGNLLTINHAIVVDHCDTYMCISA